MAKNAGKLYVLTNPAMRGLVKIGSTKGSINRRLSALSSKSGVPFRFECYFAAEVPLMEEKERILQRLFAKYRVNPKREFFRVDPERVVDAITMGPYKEATPSKPNVNPEEEKAFQKAKKTEIQRLANFTFDSVGIPVGAKLRFTRNENVIATVEPGNHVRYKGHTHSITGAAKLALKKEGKYCVAIRGPSYWTYKGKTLTEIHEAAGL